MEKLKGRIFERDEKRFVALSLEDSYAEGEVVDSKFTLTVEKSIIYNKHFPKLAIVVLTTIFMAMIAVLLAVKVSTH